MYICSRATAIVLLARFAKSLLERNVTTPQLCGYAASRNRGLNSAVRQKGGIGDVILMLTKLYDFNLGSVTESSLWRSTDYGTTYEKLNEKVGAKTVLSYLYVSPNNKRKHLATWSLVLVLSLRGERFDDVMACFGRWKCVLTLGLLGTGQRGFV
ncbi:hypothetical protein ANANG_G00052000 [Anguilla anguilla]|uniref:Sortilin N-terminal domain-containing protein n=1 Tax=Anguilla anguilla TaxID=7936 RepID=A0A9D3MXN5_ANGAN|nr:hypothetical protein ANANG_G00052000 [Anguilla anguilla]